MEDAEWHVQTNIDKEGLEKRYIHKDIGILIILFTSFILAIKIIAQL